MYEKVKKKVSQILENPQHFKPLGNVLKKYRRAHIDCYVIAFRIFEDEKTVKFVVYGHHDDIYERGFSEQISMTEEKKEVKHISNSLLFKLLEKNLKEE